LLDRISKFLCIFCHPYPYLSSFHPASVPYALLDKRSPRTFESPHIGGNFGLFCLSAILKPLETFLKNLPFCCLCGFHLAVICLWIIILTELHSFLLPLKYSTLHLFFPLAHPFLMTSKASKILL
jgi:hypothetical protein